MNKRSKNIDRRTFIKSAAGAAAAGMVAFPHVVKGQSAGVSPNDKLNIGFVGVGGRGRSSLIAIGELGHNVIGLCDVDQRQVERARTSSCPCGQFSAVSKQERDLHINVVAPDRKRREVGKIIWSIDSVRRSY